MNINKDFRNAVVFFALGLCAALFMGATATPISYTQQAAINHIAIPVAAHTNTAALTADITLTNTVVASNITALARPYQRLTPNASGWKVILGTAGVTDYWGFRALANDSATYGLNVYQPDGTTFIVTIAPNGSAAFKQLDTSTWTLF